MSSLDDEISFSSNSTTPIGTGSSSGGGGVGLPKLFKNYDTVLKTAKLADQSYNKIALSKDNNDPNSILSEAKRTLSRFGGQEIWLKNISLNIFENKWISNTNKSIL